MKILFILPEFEPHTKGGICSYYRELLKNSTISNSWESIVFQGSAVDVRETETTWEGIPVRYFKRAFYERFKNQFEKFAIYPELQNHLASAWGIFEQVNEEKIDYDLVVTTDWGFAYIPWLIDDKVPVVVHLHGSNGQIDHFEPRKGLELLSNMYLVIETAMLSEAAALVTHSNQNIEFWQSFFNKEKKIDLISPIINIDRNYEQQNKIERYGLVIGRLQYWKGIFLLCDAIRLLPTSYRSKLKVKWIGRDTIFQTENISVIKYLEDNYSDVWNKEIIPIGERNHSEIKNEISKASWGLVCSEWDMFNITAAEHIASENYLICSKKAGISDFLHDLQGVALFDATPNNLASAIVNVLNAKQETLDSLAKQSREIFEKRMDSDYILKKHKALFEKMLKDYDSNTCEKKQFEWLKPKNKNENTIYSTLDSLSLKSITKYSYKRILKNIFNKIIIQ